MSENLRHYHRATFGLNAVVARVDPERWDEPSKCADWSCREVLGHVIWLTRSLAAQLGVGEALPETPEAEVAGPDPAATWDAAFGRALIALDQDGVLQREIPGPFGPMTTDDRIRITALDNYTHTWDIAAALGMDPALDPHVAEALLPGLREAGPGLRAPGLLGPAIDIDSDAGVIDQLLAFSGRDPR